jgi:hypothetical protein
MAKTARGVWARRVRGWRAGGLTAEAFAGREGCQAATLRWWAWRLSRDGHRERKFVVNPRGEGLRELLMHADGVDGVVWDVA